MRRLTLSNKRTQMIIVVLLFILILIIINPFKININLGSSSRLTALDVNIPEKKEPFSPAPAPTIIVQPQSSISRSPKEVNAIDRFWNPLRYPYRSDYFYDQAVYPQNNLPFQVIGGGRRMAPTLGGSEIPIANPMMPLDVSEAPIAPIHITTRGPRGLPQQLGVIYKIQGDHNTYLPLFGMKEYPNSDSYKYYTAVGQNSQIKVPLLTKYKNQPLGDGDEVIIKGQSEKYRVSLYDSDFPQYIPYL